MTPVPNLGASLVCASNAADTQPFYYNIANDCFVFCCDTIATKQKIKDNGITNDGILHNSLLSGCSPFSSITQFGCDWKTKNAPWFS
jgi:hypothetical protein